MNTTMLFLDYAEHDGPFNMALDAALLLEPPVAPVLRLYGWNPATISLGRFQTMDEPLRFALKDTPLTRRTTGGGAIYHGDELTYSVVGSLDALGLTGREQLYMRMHEAWMGALCDFAGVPNDTLWMPIAHGQTAAINDEAFFCFTRRAPYDVVADSSRYPDDGAEQAYAALAREYGAPASFVTRKLIGSAQRHRGGIVLQHGSIHVKRNPIAPWALSVEEFVGRPLTPADVAAQIREPFARALGVSFEPWCVPQATLAAARRIADEQFANPAWVNDGRKKNF